MAASDQRTVRYFYEAVAAWNLDDTAAGILIGVSPRTVRDWKTGKFAEPSEEVLARMMMVVQIRTALDICWSTPLANEWISLPNAGDPYQGLSPIAYVAEHGWPGLYYILRQVEARAAGNY
jgi:hypothetical protein